MDRWVPGDLGEGYDVSGIPWRVGAPRGLSNSQSVRNQYTQLPRLPRSYRTVPPAAHIVWRETHERTPQTRPTFGNH